MLILVMLAACAGRSTAPVKLSPDAPLEVVGKALLVLEQRALVPPDLQAIQQAACGAVDCDLELPVADSMRQLNANILAINQLATEGLDEDRALARTVEILDAGARAAGEHWVRLAVQHRGPAVIGAAVRRSGGSISVEEVLPGQPAQVAGLQAGDQILAVDGQSAVGLSPSEVASAFTGEPGSTCLIEVRRGEEALTLSVRREVHKEPAATVDVADGIVLLTLQSLPQHSARQLQRRLDGLAEDDWQSLIIDLRGNSGGHLEEAAAVADLFVDDLQLYTLNGESREATTGTYPSVPTTIMVDEETSGGAQLLTCALRHGRGAVIVGTAPQQHRRIQHLYVFEEGKVEMAIHTENWRCAGEKEAPPGDTLFPVDHPLTWEGTEADLRTAARWLQRADP